VAVKETKVKAEAPPKKKSQKVVAEKPVVEMRERS